MPSSRVHRAELKLMCEGLVALRSKVSSIGDAEAMSKANAIRHLAKKLDCDKWLGQEAGEPPTKREFVTKEPLPDVEGLPPAKRD